MTNHTFPMDDPGLEGKVAIVTGGLSQGATREETIENVKEAVAAHVQALELDGLPVPEEKSNAQLIAI